MRLSTLLLIGVTCITPLQATAANDGFYGNRNIQFTVDFNFFSGSPNSIVATGAFNDSGTIGHGTDEFFRGVVAKVVDSPNFSNGTITWELNNVYIQRDGASTNGDMRTSQSWRIISGTGKYEGISGHGNSQGLWNGIIGSIRVTGYGTVDCPKC